MPAQRSGVADAERGSAPAGDRQRGLAVAARGAAAAAADARGAKSKVLGYVVGVLLAQHVPAQARAPLLQAAVQPDAHLKVGSGRTRPKPLLL
jgi:hypothetical protein